MPSLSRYLLVSLVGVSCLAIAAAALSSTQQKTFTAKRACIVHELPKAASKSLGRLEPGDSATVLPDDPENKWIKIEANGVLLRARMRVDDNQRERVSQAVVGAKLGLLGMQTVSSGLESVFLKLSSEASSGAEKKPPVAEAGP